MNATFGATTGGPSRPTVSVAIPVKNGGKLLLRVLDAVHEQVGVDLVDVVVVDSGSTDGMLDDVRKRPLVKLREIPASDFGHGRTRNLAVSLATGSLVAMITQDALPADQYWLHHLVAPFADPEVAGVFGRHIAHEAHARSTAKELDDFFYSLLLFGTTVSLDRHRKIYATDTSFRQSSHFFSDNNACLRRSVWEKIPYRDVNFAEDQLWAKEILEAGYRKAYAPSAVVHHSHEFLAHELFQRSFDEARSLRSLFGYRSVHGVFGATATSWASGIADAQASHAAGLPKKSLQRIVRRFAQQYGRLLGQNPMAPFFEPWCSRERRIIEGR